MAWDLAAIRSRIGEHVTYTAPEPLGRAAIRYFAEAIGDDNPLYTDAAHARAAGYDDVVAPPTLLMETNQYVPGRARDDAGYKGHQWDLPVSGCRLIRGGNRYEFHAPVHPDDVVTATWQITSADEKTSGSGARMLLVGSEARFTRADGTLLAVDRETLIFQEVGA
jgi:acyl dehydratase